MSKTAAPTHVLVIEDDADTRANLDILGLDGYVVETAGTVAEALSRRDWARIAIIILDRRLPDGDAEDLLPKLKHFAPHAAVIISTGYADVQGAILAVRLGAADYILKPINPDELRTRLGHLAERMRAEEQVRAMTQQLWQAAKLASVGELAASIAHELNNPLATVRLRIESVLGRISAEDRNRRALEIIQQEAKRMGDLVANLLQFSRRGADELSTVEVRAELLKALELVQHLFRKRLIVVGQELAADTPTIYADRQKLRQVFLNLLTNACDAMPKGGTLTLRAASGTMEAGQASVQIEFTDTGVGIPPENLAKVTESFFTTKEEGKGTGLGLAICRRVVQEHQGTMDITSEVGKGTTIRIVLPVKNPANVDRLRGNDVTK